MWSSGAIALMWIRRASSGSGASARAAAAISDRISTPGSIHQLREVAKWRRARPRSAWPSSPDRRAAATTDRRLAFSRGDRGPLSASAMIHAWRRSSSAGTSIGSASASSLSDHVHAADLVRDVRGAQEPRATCAAVRAQRGRPLERRNRDRECAAPDRPVGRGVKERGGGLVGHVGRGRPMPAARSKSPTTPASARGHAAALRPSPAAGSPTG